MEKTTLVFRTAFDIWKYKQKISTKELEINLSERTITAQLTLEDVDLAISEFGAIRL